MNSPVLFSSPPAHKAEPSPISQSGNFWIVLVNFNGWEDSVLCLESLKQMVTRASVVLVDNASRDRRLQELKEKFPWVHTVQNDANGGWAGGNNTGIRHALEHGAEQVLLLNNDTIVSGELVHRLLAAADSHPDYGILGPVIHFMEEPEEVMTDGCMFNQASLPGFFQRKEIPVQNVQSPTVTEVDIVNGCAMMIRREVFARIGLVDERFFLIHEESDFCLRAREAGFRCGIVAIPLVWHKGSSSFKRTGRGWQRYYDARNLLLLLNKHPHRQSQKRGYSRSLVEYIKYVYYRYCLEMEQGQPEAAKAVLNGVHDALAGRFGPLAESNSRLVVPALSFLMDWWRRNRLRQGNREVTKA